MRQFADSTGKNYSIALNIGAIKRCREETGIDLLDPTGERTQPAASDVLRSDLVSIGEVLFAVCRPDCTKEEFLELLQGEVLRSACRCFWEEWSDFFLQAGDELLGNQIAEIYEATVDLAKAAAKKTKALFKKARARLHEDLDQEISRAMSELEPQEQHGTSSGSEQAS